MPPRRVPNAANISQEELDRVLALNAALLARVGNNQTDAIKMSNNISRHNPSKYDGEGAPGLLAEWCREFESIFKLLAVPESMKVDQAVFYLKGTARLWWNNNEEEIKAAAAEIGAEFVSWAGFKEILSSKFVSEHVKGKLRAEFDAFKMAEGMTVEAYHTKFMQLAENVADLGYTTEMLAARFERGLTIEIKRSLLESKPTTVEDLYERDGQAERIADMIKEDEKARGDKRKVESAAEGSGNKRQNNHYRTFFTNNATGGNANRGGVTPPFI